jgi:hypothetical protein
MAVNAVRFQNPDEDTTATVDRLVMAASYWRVSGPALRSLVHLTALACGSDKVVSMTLPTADIDELESKKLLKQTAHDTVVLL